MRPEVARGDVTPQRRIENYGNHWRTSEEARGVCERANVLFARSYESLEEGTRDCSTRNYSTEARKELQLEREWQKESSDVTTRGEPVFFVTRSTLRRGKTPRKWGMWRAASNSFAFKRMLAKYNDSITRICWKVMTAHSISVISSPSMSSKCSTPKIHHLKSTLPKSNHTHPLHISMIRNHLIEILKKIPKKKLKTKKTHSFFPPPASHRLCTLQAVC